MIAIIDSILAMFKNHWFWAAVTVACLAWYSTVTIYVAIRGAADIRSMLRRLSDGNKGDCDPDL